MGKPLTLATALAVRTCIAAASIWLVVAIISVSLAYRELHGVEDARTMLQTAKTEIAPKATAEQYHSPAVTPPPALLQQTISAAWPHLALSGAGLLALLLVVFTSLRQRLHQPLRALTEGLQRMSRGDREYRLSLPGGHELAMLGQYCNLLAEQSAQQHESLRQTFSGRMLELESECAAARSANANKREQLMILGHELRTPLNGIAGALEMLAHAPGRTERQQLLASASQSASHLRGLADRLLDLSCLEAGCTRLQPAQVPLLQLIDETILAILPEVRRKKLTLSVLARTDPRLEVTVDALRLRQILLNLLGNAIKFTPNGSVALEARHENGLLIMTVTDSGPGIPEAMRERIFEPFTRIDHDQPGTGLGLAITRQLVALMGGTVTAENGASAGACFRIALPLTAMFTDGPRPLAPTGAPAGLRPQLRAWGLTDTTAPDRASAADTPRPHQRWMKGSMAEAMTTMASEARDDDALTNPELAVLPGRLWQTLLTEAASPPRRQGMPSECPWSLEILLVDDMASNRVVVGNMLTLLGHRVATASGGREALRQGRSRVFDLLILDLGMAQTSGLQAARAWRDPKNHMLDPDCRIAALTGSARSEDRDEARAAGMHDYLLKPVTMHQLAVLIDDACEYQLSRGVELTPRAEWQRPMLDTSHPELLKRLVLDLGTSVRALRNAIRRRDLEGSRRLLHALQGCAGQAGLADAEREIMHLARVLGSLDDSDRACCAYRLDRLDQCIQKIASSAPVSAESFQQAKALRPVHQFGNIVGVKLAHQVQPVRFHRFQANGQQF